MIVGYPINGISHGGTAQLLKTFTDVLCPSDIIIVGMNSQDLEANELIGLGNVTWYTPHQQVKLWSDAGLALRTCYVDNNSNYGILSHSSETSQS